MMTAKGVLLYLYVKYNKVWDLMYEAMLNKEKLNKELEMEFEGERKNGFVCLTDKEYPQEYKNLDKPPFILERIDGKLVDKQIRLNS